MPGRTAHVGERSGVGAGAEPPPRLPRTPVSLWGRGEDHRAGQRLRGKKGRAEGGGRRGGALTAAGVAGRGLLRGSGGSRGRRDPHLAPSSPYPQAAAYGRCVQASTAPGGRLRKDLCAQEFEALRSCFLAAVGGRRPPGGGTRGRTPRARACGCFRRALHPRRRVPRPSSGAPASPWR